MLKQYDRFNKRHVVLTESAKKSLPFTTEPGYEIPKDSVFVLDRDLDRFLRNCSERGIEVHRLGCGRDHIKNGDLFIPFVVVSDELKFKYMLLGRLQADCEYFFGFGGRNEKHLWAGNFKDQIAKMKEIWNEFGVYAKPEWISMEDIEAYERRGASNE